MMKSFVIDSVVDKDSSRLGNGARGFGRHVFFWGAILALSLYSPIWFSQGDAQEPVSATEEEAVEPDWLTGLESTSPSFRLIRDIQARKRYHLDGAGLAVVIIDSGANGRHPALSPILLPGRNFTDSGTSDDTRDKLGTGSHRAGVIAAQEGAGIPPGVAPGAKIIPAKVLRDNGEATVEGIVNALRWAADPNTSRYYLEEHNVVISAVCLGLGVGGNFTRVDQVPERHLPIASEIKNLRASNIVVCAPAGNQFQKYDCQEGMFFPGICPETISVGSVYDANIDNSEGDDPLIEHSDGTRVYITRKDQISVFSQRLSADSAPDKIGTDVFAPGASIPSAGIGSDDKILLQSGTSVSTAYAIGAVVLLQERCRKLTQKVGRSDPGWLPEFDLIRDCLHEGAVTIEDESEDSQGKSLDSVRHTGQEYRRLDVLGSVRILDERYQADVIRFRQKLLRSNRDENPNGDESAGPTWAAEAEFKILGKGIPEETKKQSVTNP